MMSRDPRFDSFFGGDSRIRNILAPPERPWVPPEQCGPPTDDLCRGDVAAPEPSPEPDAPADSTRGFDVAYERPLTPGQQAAVDFVRRDLYVSLSRRVYNPEPADPIVR